MVSTPDQNKYIISGSPASSINTAVRWPSLGVANLQLRGSAPGSTNPAHRPSASQFPGQTDLCQGMLEGRRYALASVLPAGQFRHESRHPRGRLLNLDVCRRL